MRHKAAVLPGTPLAEALEMLRTGAYPVIPVVSPNGFLVGMLGECDLAIQLSSGSSADRAALLRSPVAEILSSPVVFLRASQPVSEALFQLQESCHPALPVVDDSGRYLGIVGPADFVREMVRPLRPPMLGGLATPAGVYLTNGAVTGGVGTVALLVTGLAFCSIHLLAYFLTLPLLSFVGTLPIMIRSTAENLLVTVVQVGLLLTIIRLTPIAGYHAAEHQVVHAVERGEPLIVDVVRQMPRVHPRCGTNLVGGALLASLIGIFLQPIIGGVGYLIGGAVALATWRDVGAWLQQHITTRPASDKELRSGIKAANAVMERYSAVSSRSVSPIARVWNMGFLPLIAGFLIGCALVYGLSGWFPALKEPLRSYLLGW